MNLEHANRLITWTSQSHPSKTYRSLYWIESNTWCPLLTAAMILADRVQLSTILGTHCNFDPGAHPANSHASEIAGILDRTQMSDFIHYCIDTISERPLLRGLIVWLFTLCLSGAATAAADQSPNCLTPAPHDGRAESAAVTFSVLGVDGTPAGTDTVWQPLGGTISFSLKGSGLSDKPPIVCFAYHGGPFAAQPTRLAAKQRHRHQHTGLQRHRAAQADRPAAAHRQVLHCGADRHRRPVGKDPGDRAGWQRLGPD